MKVTLVMALTLDGKIGRSPDHFPDWTGKEDKKSQEISNDIEKEGFSDAVLAGGALVNSLFAEEKLIDEIIVTISPKIFGYGISLFSDEIFMDLELAAAERVGSELVYLKYKVKK